MLMDKIRVFCFITFDFGASTRNEISERQQKIEKWFKGDKTALINSFYAPLRSTLRIKSRKKYLGILFWLQTRSQIGMNNLNLIKMRKKKFLYHVKIRNVLFIWEWRESEKKNVNNFFSRTVAHHIKCQRKHKETEWNRSFLYSRSARDAYGAKGADYCALLSMDGSRNSSRQRHS